MFILSRSRHTKNLGVGSAFCSEAKRPCLAVKQTEKPWRKTMAWGPKTETGALKEQIAFEDLAFQNCFFSGCLIATSSYLYPQWLKTSIISIPIKLTIDYSGPRRLCLRRNSWTDCWPYTEPSLNLWQNQTGWISQVINPSPIPTKDHPPRICKLKIEIELGKKSQMKNMLHKMVVSAWPCHVWKLPHLRLAWGPWTATVVAKICSWHQWNCPKPTSISRVGEIQIMLDNILWSSSWQYKPRLAHSSTKHMPIVCECVPLFLPGFVFANYMNISCRFMHKGLKL